MVTEVEVSVAEAGEGVERSVVAEEVVAATVAARLWSICLLDVLVVASTFTLSFPSSQLS